MLEHESKYQKSTACGGGSCVEVALLENGVAVRGVGGSLLRFDHEEWQAFVVGVKNGEFDLPGS